MNLVWNFDGVSVGAVTTNRWVETEMWTFGYAWKGGRVIEWEATVKPGGWYVSLRGSLCRLGGFQGSTFNLPLEIVAAVRRLS